MRFVAKSFIEGFCQKVACQFMIVIKRHFDLLVIQYLQFYWVDYFSHMLGLSHKLDFIRWLPIQSEVLMR